MTTQSDLSLSRRHVLLAGASAGFLGAAGLRAAKAAAPFANTQIPAWYRFKIGDFEATVVSDGALPIGAPADTFKGLPAQDLERLLVDNFLAPDAITLEQNALVVNTGRNLILFDTGVGTTKAFGPGTGKLLSNLRAADIDPGQIDALCITHAHVDHCWALVGDDGKLNFPNARVYIARADFDFWTDEGKLSGDSWIKDFIAGGRRQLLPVRDRMTFVEDGKEAVPGVVALSAPGHTVGHTADVISSGTQSLMFSGDLAHHHVLLLQRPRLEFAFDTDPKQGVASRMRVFDMVAANRMPIVSYHFPFPGLGHLTKAGEGYGWYPAPLRMTL